MSLKMTHVGIASFGALCFGAPSATAQLAFTEIPNDFLSRSTAPSIALIEGPGGLYETGMQIPEQVPLSPFRAHGSAGVAVIDFDGDGDPDIFATNGAGGANVLLENDGYAGFVDVALSAGIAAPDHVAGGLCYGDLDNDGDPDIVVLGQSDEHRVYRNDDGVFSEITATAGLRPGAAARNSSSCSIGDIDGDGFVDLAIANTWVSWDNMLPIFTDAPELVVHNELYRNNRDLTFTDVSVSSGFNNTRGFSGAGTFDGMPTITWGIAIVDYDGDGDQDIIHADDQGAFPSAALGGQDRGILHLFENDGSGNLTDVTAAAGISHAHGGWMALSFGDLNHDGTLDIFASNNGDYLFFFMGAPFAILGDGSTRWFNQGDGSFEAPGVGDLIATPFAWGNATFDADLDGDLDLVALGGLDVNAFVEMSNPGMLLENDGSATFTQTFGVLSPRHANRAGHGLAIGDLDGDGCDDIVTVSSSDSNLTVPMNIGHGSPFDATASFVPTFVPAGDPDNPGFSIKNPAVSLLPGSMAIELNDCNQGNHSLQIDTVGSVGVTANGRTNRSGIGATISVAVAHGKTGMRPVVGGEGHMSQSSDVLTFGLGSAGYGRVEVRWTGGATNRLYGVRAGERIEFPEIGCDMRTEESFPRYLRCVRSELGELKRAGVLSHRAAVRFFASALVAYWD